MTFYYEEKKPVLHDVFMEFKRERFMRLLDKVVQEKQR